MTKRIVKNNSILIDKIMKRNLIVALLILILFVSACTSEDVEDVITAEPIETNTKEQTAAMDKEIIEKSVSSENLRYLGAFRLPEDGNAEKNMFSYGGEALCYNPANDSLFISGHNWYTYVAEISIPEIILSKDVSLLNQSEKLNGFSDIKGNLFDEWTMEIPRVGMEVIEDKLFFCFGEHYEEDTLLGTHGYTDLKLEPASKVCIIGDDLYATNDYMFKIPDEYISYFGGNNLLTGRFRDGGWSGMGPSLFAVSMKNIIDAENNERIESVPIIKYEDSYNEENGKIMNDYSHADSWTGGVFVYCETGSGILFIGTHGFGKTWYGFANGVVYPTNGDENEIYPEVPDYPYDERGWWNDDFRACIAFYSTQDAIDVYSGQLEAEDIQPYEFVDITEYMIVNRDKTVMQYLGASAYDQENSRLFLLELMADEDKPIVHVFTFE